MNLVPAAPMALVALLVGGPFVTACSARECLPGAGEDDDAWRAVCDLLDEGVITRMSFVAGDATGRRFFFARGGAAADDELAIASASKWLAGAALLRLVEREILTLDDRPQDHVPWASRAEGDPRATVTLRQLLSLTSGFQLRPIERSCTDDGDTTLDTCAQELYNTRLTHDPGMAFDYGGAHLHIAAAMAEAATQTPFADLFTTEVQATLGLESTAFDYPSRDNPRVEGGARSSAVDYERFLLAILRGEILAPSVRELSRDHTPSDAVELAYSPVSDIDREWHYGLGSWRECAAGTWEPACDERVRSSSPGAFGFYPWIDFSTQTYGVLATERWDVRAAYDSVLLVEGARAALDAALAR